MNVAFFDTTIGSSNIGDIIIQNSIVSALAAFLDKAFIIKFSTHLHNFSLFENFINPKARFARTCDYKFIAGTSLLSSNLMSTYSQWQIGPLSARIYNKSILVGVGTTFDNKEPSLYSKYIYNQILRSDIIHSVRDEQSLRFIQSMGYKAINTGCPTLWKCTPDFCSSIPVEKSDNVIISVSGNSKFRSPEKDKCMIQQIDSLYKRKYVWIQTMADEAYFDSLVQDKSKYKKVYSLIEYKRICDMDDVEYVGTRLHGGIFAIQNKKRALIIAIDHRAREFNLANNLNIIERDDIETLSDKLVGKIDTKIHLNQDGINNWLAQFDL